MIFRPRWPQATCRTASSLRRTSTAAVPGAAGLNLNNADRKSIVPSDYNNSCLASASRGSPSLGRNVVVRGGYGIVLRTRHRCFRELAATGSAVFPRAAAQQRRQLEHDSERRATFPVPNMSIGFDDGEPILVGDNDPDTEFEAFETQMVSPELTTPYTHQWNLTTQWEFRPNWLLEAATSAARARSCSSGQSQPADRRRRGRVPARGGVPGGGFTGNYFDIVNDQFVSAGHAAGGLHRR